MGIEITGLFALIIVIADIWAILHVVQSRSSPGAMALWIVGILLFPLAGLLVWWIFGPRSRRR